ncbi:hypothetical protein KI809_18355 [Geobacter pelophilus]|uniref:Uncharacterized protein n=1 Tax=Geoanaerobacter pelophilus TaxID=60036 RepID=A0AAW4LEE3_9BACT|nr:hypothetical protein [Geoanaerobacter pelophilus]MBT0666277.1 hypothetical protein [Geoanaerobacter pelophilus]
MVSTTILAAVISAGAAIIVVALTNYFAKRREHAADWRKMKLELYREYILALSGVVEERSTAEAQAKYSDAVNSLLLVAPPAIMNALDAFLAYTSYRNQDKDVSRHDQLLGALIKAMRADLQPTYKSEDTGLSFRLLGLPPH